MGKGNDFWLDDPEWEFLRRKAEKRPIPKKLKRQVAAQKQPIRPRQEELPRAQASKQVTEKEVVVNLKLRMPKVKLPNFKRLLKVYRKQSMVTGGVVVVLVLAGGVFRFNANRQAKEEANKPKSAQEQALAEFNPLVPLENLTDNAGKQAEPEFRYDKEKKVLGYATEYNGTQLTISQQKLPDSFKSNPAGLISIADSIKASIPPLDTQKGPAYIATNEKTKTQTALFATDEVLVFVQTSKVLDDEEWKFYINQLNPSK
jgi:hypothetical protein